jgi:hypothetical protein
MSSLSRFAFLPTLLIGFTTASPAQSVDLSSEPQLAESGKRTCWRGRPQPACDVFWITELGFYPRLRATTKGQPPALDAHGSAELGRMVNKGRSALGVLVTVGPNDRWGLLLRHRRWIGSEGTFDVTAGVIHTEINHPEHSFLDKQGFGVTGDIALGWRDYGQIVLRGDLARTDRTAGELYGGVRLGSKPAVAAATTGAVLLGVYYILFLIGTAQGDF